MPVPMFTSAGERVGVPRDTAEKLQSLEPWAPWGPRGSEGVPPSPTLPPTLKGGKLLTEARRLQGEVAKASEYAKTVKEKRDAAERELLETHEQSIAAAQADAAASKQSGDQDRLAAERECLILGAKDRQYAIDAAEAEVYQRQRALWVFVQSHVEDLLREIEPEVVAVTAKLQGLFAQHRAAVAPLLSQWQEARGLAEVVGNLQPFTSDDLPAEGEFERLPLPDAAAWERFHALNRPKPEPKPEPEAEPVAA